MTWQTMLARCEKERSPDRNKHGKAFVMILNTRAPIAYTHTDSESGLGLLLAIERHLPLEDPSQALRHSLPQRRAELTPHDRPRLCEWG